MWIQLMRTSNLTQAQDLGSYTKLIQSQKSRASKLFEQENVVHLHRHSSVTQGFVLFCLKYFFPNNS